MRVRGFGVGGRVVFRFALLDEVLSLCFDGRSRVRARYTLIGWRDAFAVGEGAAMLLRSCGNDYIPILST